MVALIILALGVGYYAGTKGIFSKGPSESKCLSIVNSVFPKPADMIKNSGGTVKGIYGALVSVEMNDPEDYLPHTDGTAQKKVSIGLNITAKTNITTVSLATGTEKAAKLSDVKVGDTVRFWSSANIRNAKQVDATVIQLIK